jgi:hypothetical protein
VTNPTPARLKIARTGEHEVEAAVEHAARLAFAPLHKRVFGTALGLVCALTLGTLTLIVWAAGDTASLALLAVYFRGYEVSPRGALVGAAWAGFVGFVAGWFMAFCRNLVVATWLLYIRARASLIQTRDFLDHV